MNCIILAAGKNTRLDTGVPKSLVNVNGETLLSRHIRLFKLLGVKKFCIISGYRAEKLNLQLRPLLEKHDVDIEIVHNARFDLENGYSVFAARDWARSLGGEGFFLTMGDHIFHPDFMKLFIKKSENNPCALQLAVDIPGPLNRHIDLEDVTKVNANAACLIESIGKGIAQYNFYDTGLFRLKTQVFDVLERCFSQNKFTISDMVSDLVMSGNALAVPVSGFTWNDIDNKNDLEKTLELLEDFRL